jgi:lsr operon transcriptional repressor
VRVAWYYYKDELTQDEIASRMSISRASVGRMLERARRSGLVSITINSDYLGSFELAKRLRERYALLEVLVVPEHEDGVATQRTINTRVGVCGAQYLNTHLKPGASLGVGWGDTVARVVAATDLAALGPQHLVSLTGGVEGYLHTLMYSRPEGHATSADLITASIIPSPIVASTDKLASVLRGEPTIRQVIDQAKTVPLAVVGVGTPAPDSTLVQMGYVSARDAKTLARSGVVGDILGQFYDAQGTLVDLPLHDRRIGIQLSDLAEIGRVVGVAGGLSKLEAIRGALRGRYLDVLVTTEDVAESLLASADV